jgi:histidinol-phosphate/aromatic aminotransferase/cobyric acid decarboxylase-like protein
MFLLERYNIMIKDCNSKKFLQGKNYIRISVRNQEDNDRLVQALKELAEI